MAHAPARGIEHRHLVVLAEARGALEQGAADLGVGCNAALAHRVGEVAVGGDSVLDGATGDAEEIG
jgi:hypothetical protein